MFKVARVYALVELSEQGRRSVHVYGTVLRQFVIPMIEIRVRPVIYSYSAFKRPSR
jgi:hypothetical protein